MAKSNALIQSVAIGANVIEVISIEASGTDVTRVGRLPHSALHQPRPAAGRLEARTHEIYAFHSLRRKEESLGFLVVQPPVRITCGILPEDEIVSIALRISRAEAARLQIAINDEGPACCRRCNQVISLARLRAVKNARFCVQCQYIKEKRR